MIRNAFLIIFIIQVFYSCAPKEKIDVNKFDRKVMLQNYVDNLIKPAYNDLKTQTDLLQTLTETFVTTTNLANLKALQSAWTSAYTAYQYTNSYNFGPASEEGLRKILSEEIGTFPASTVKIDNNITQNNANLNDFNRDARGFLAVEYLIFNLTNDNNLLIENFSTQSSFQNRKTLLSKLVADIKLRIDNVNTAWNGTFATEFVSNAGTEAGSSTSLLYNDFVRSYEALKNFKVAVPLGKRAGQTQTAPETVDAYYSSKTLLMLQNNIDAIDNIWNGKSKNGVDGVGFKEYLETVEGGNDLIKLTETQMQVIKVALAAIPSTTSMANQIDNSPALLEKLQIELQKQVRFYKSDMSSRLGIAITYTSGDGD